MYIRMYTFRNEAVCAKHLQRTDKTLQTKTFLFDGYTDSMYIVQRNLSNPAPLLTSICLNWPRFSGTKIYLSYKLTSIIKQPANPVLFIIPQWVPDYTGSTVYYSLTAKFIFENNFNLNGKKLRTYIMGTYT